MNDKFIIVGKDNSPSETKIVGGIAIKEALSWVPGGHALLDLLNARKEMLRESVRKDEEQRYEDFSKGLLNSDVSMDEITAESMIVSKDFHALLRACLTDIESEKVSSYSSMAIAIAIGKIPQNWRRHFILALRDFSTDELNHLQKALIARTHPLIPASGPSVDESHFLQLGEPGSIQNITIKNLVAKGFVNEGKLSETGVEFTKACFNERALSPNSIGFQTWTGKSIAILDYQIGDPIMDKLAFSIQDTLRKSRIQSSIFAVTQRTIKNTSILFDQSILLLGTTEEMFKHSAALVKYLEKIPTIVFKTSEKNIQIPEGISPSHVINTNDQTLEETLDNLLKIII